MSIFGGGKEALYSPPFLSCGSETHEPFRLIDRPIKFLLEPDQSLAVEALWGVVKTSSWHYEGDRTDLHDVWSLCWAAFLRAAGIASPWLIDEDGWCGTWELAGRHLVIQPHSRDLHGGDDFQRVRSALNA